MEVAVLKAKLEFEKSGKERAEKEAFKPKQLTIISPIIYGLQLPHELSRSNRGNAHANLWHNYWRI